MDPLSLTTLQKSFNMAVLFQPSIVLKPNPPSSFGLHWTSWSYGSYRWVRDLTKRNPECSMKWISISSPEAWKRTTNKCEGLQALRSASLSWQAAFFSFWYVCLLLLLSFDEYILYLRRLDILDLTFSLFLFDCSESCLVLLFLSSASLSAWAACLGLSEA